MSTVTVTSKNFAALVKKPGIVVLDFWAAWCGPCRMFAPIFEAASQRHPDITWGKVDTDAEQELAGNFEIRSIPTLMVIRDGVLVFVQPGMLPAAALDQLIQKVRSLDMVELNARIARAKTGHAPHPLSTRRESPSCAEGSPAAGARSRRSPGAGCTSSKCSEMFPKTSDAIATRKPTLRREARAHPGSRSSSARAERPSRAARRRAWSLGHPCLADQPRPSVRGRSMSGPELTSSARWNSTGGRDTTDDEVPAW